MPIRDGVTSVETSAAIQVDSTTTGGLPVPRVTTTQRDAIASPATGLLVFNTTTGVYNVYSGSAWVALGGTTGALSGPASSTDDGIVRWNGTTGLVVQNSTSTIDDNGALTLQRGAVLNESGADSDTRIEGDTDTSLFHADASTDRVGIGTATPSTKLDVNGTANATAMTSAAGTFTVGTLTQLVFAASTELTIASGAVTAGAKTFYTIDTEADAASDDLDTINGGAAGEVLILRANNGGRTVVVTTAGNIVTPTGSSITLDETYKLLWLIYDGDLSKWVVSFYSGSSATDSDAIHDNVAGEINAIASKATPVSGDLLLIEDSADSNNKKKITVGDLPSATYPLRATAWCDEFLSIAGNALTFQILSTQRYSTYISRLTAAANGDAFTTSVFLRAGTYNMSVLGITGTNAGIIDWTIDGGAAISGQDWYNGSQQLNHIKSGSVVISGDGVHVVTGTVNGKNASSSSYFINITKIWFAPASD